MTPQQWGGGARAMTSGARIAVSSSPFSLLALQLLCWGLALSLPSKETFDHEEITWTTARENRFTHDLAWQHKDDPRYPQTDTTLGNENGGYSVAAHSYDDASNSSAAERALFSQCLEPMGPKCSFHFRYWMSPSLGQQEALKVSLLFFCNFCQTPDKGMELAHIRNDNASSGWRQYSVRLEKTYSMFVVIFQAYVPDENSVIALDDLSFEDCPLETEERICGDDEFQCTGTTQCIPADRVCDLHADCQCGQDETSTLCELIPEGGRVSFTDCNFTAGLCYWFNIPFLPADAEDERSWRVMTSRGYRAQHALILPDPAASGQPGAAYAYVRLKKKRRSHVLRSVPFPACSSHDGQCKVRFQYWQSARDVALRLELIELHNKDASPRYRKSVTAPHVLWTSSGGDRRRTKTWHRVQAPINLRSRHSYVLQLMVERSEEGFYPQAVAVTSLTLSSHCFAQAVNLTTCGATGPHGPTPAACNRTYGDRHDVHVLDGHSPWAGAQVYSVPVSTIYRLQAHGARGGNGEERLDLESAFGTLVLANFRLYKGEQLLVVVGQSGHSYCQGVAGGGRTGHAGCHLEGQKNTTVFKSGGGGGGATFVYRKQLGSEVWELLLMAGGGGGLPYASFAPGDPSTWRQHNSTGPAADTMQSDADSAGGTNPWLYLNESSVFVGQGCPVPNSLAQTMGGFGGGFGACNETGGHGGGYLGSLKIAGPTAGQPGGVYVHSDSLYFTLERRRHGAEGRLEIVDRACPCHFLCVVQQPDLLGQPGVKAIEDGVLICICQEGYALKEDGLSCEAVNTSALPVVQEATSGNRAMPVGLAVLLSVILVIIVLIILLASFVTYAMRMKPGDERLWAFRMLVNQCLRVRVRQVPLHTFPYRALPARVMQINPAYGFPPGKLPEIPRDNLRISTQLGEGAFGEVYKAFLSCVSGTEREVAVAVKTLPPMCNEQMEIDFFMEAFIISKFHHPNIVRFLGVSFEQHPRYLVLELLEGGNLKAFLRESRSLEGTISKLTVGDLLQLAKDVACGCHYLEKMHFIHRDIAARNCLLTTKDSERMAKIADFGMSRDIYRADYYKKEGRALLPLKWMPPEAFMEGIFTVKTDVWSYGVLLWEIFSMGYMPYPGLNNTEVMNFVYIGGRLDPPEGCPSKVFDLMLSCWKHKSDERPSFDIVMQTLESVSLDTATMSQHLPPFRWPAPSEARSLKLLNPPVPAIGITSEELSSQAELSADSAIHETDPLLKPVEAASSVQPRSDTADCKLIVAMPPGNEHKKPASKLNYFEPLLSADPAQAEECLCQNGHAAWVSTWANCDNSDSERAAVHGKGRTSPHAVCNGVGRSRTNLPSQGTALPQIEEIELEDDVGRSDHAV